MQTACEHTRTQMIARRDGVDYLECLDCRQIFEAEDLDPEKVEEEEELGTLPHRGRPARSLPTPVRGC